MTTLAANIGDGSATFNDNGDFSDFTTGTDDFVNNYSYDPLGEMTKIVQTAQTAPKVTRRQSTAWRRRP